jgi:NAD(P)-dependent dehydrogenase (short-subunit alcohol dehydrogenase family)
MDLDEITRMYDFSGRAFVVTGGAGILGGELACALVGCGADVAILDRSAELAERVIHRIGRMEKPGIGRAVVVYGDVLERPTLLAARDVILKEFGGIYGLVNAAGGNRPQTTTSATQSFFGLSDVALGEVFNLNLLGTVLPSQVFGEAMCLAGEGVILNFSSMSALRPLTRGPAYSAAKAGVSNFTQWLAVHMAQEYSPRVRVNALAPGFFLTDQNRFLLTDESTGELTARGAAIIAHTPMERFGIAEDLLGAALWLLSPASAFVTGIVLPVDGGFSAYSGV